MCAYRLAQRSTRPGAWLTLITFGRVVATCTSDRLLPRASQDIVSGMAVCFNWKSLCDVTPHAYRDALLAEDTEATFGLGAI